MPQWYVQKLKQHPSAAQRRALRELWPIWGLATPRYGDVLDFRQAFGSCAGRYCVLDIGFGMGDALLEIAAARPLWNFVGIEWHRPSLGHCLQQIHERGLTNVRLMGMCPVCDRSQEVLNEYQQ